MQYVQNHNSNWFGRDANEKHLFLRRFSIGFKPAFKLCEEIFSRIALTCICIFEAAHHGGIQRGEFQFTFLDQPYALAEYFTLRPISTRRDKFGHKLFKRFS